jgi:hypothetical protein
LGFVHKARLRAFTTAMLVTPLAYWAWAVVVPALNLYFRLRSVAGAGGVSIQTGPFRTLVPPGHFLSFAWERVAFLGQQGILIIDAPGKLIEIVVSLIVAHNGNWHPAPVPEWSWRCLTYPLYAIPAWLFVGTGLDALTQRRPVARGPALIGLVFSAISALFVAGLLFGLSSAERQGEANWFLCGFALWTILFTIPFAARYRAIRRGGESRPCDTV